MIAPKSSQYKKGEKVVTYVFKMGSLADIPPSFHDKHYIFQDVIKHYNIFINTIKYFPGCHQQVAKLKRHIEGHT